MCYAGILGVRVVYRALGRYAGVRIVYCVVGRCTVW